MVKSSLRAPPPEKRPRASPPAPAPAGATRGPEPNKQPALARGKTASLSDAVRRATRARGGGSGMKLT